MEEDMIKSGKRVVSDIMKKVHPVLLVLGSAP